MSIDINACNEARRFIEYLEAFSFANVLTDSVKKEVMTIKYSAVFGKHKMLVDFLIKNEKFLINVTWMPNLYMLGNGKEIREKYDRIKSTVRLATCSIESLKETMFFVVDDFGEFNVLLDLLTES